MKLRVTDRIFAAAAGIVILACGAGIFAQTYLDVDLVGFADKVFSSGSDAVRIGLTLISVCLILLGLCCFSMSFRHRTGKDRFILQKNEGGELAISVQAMENMVRKCLDQHAELQVDSLDLENRKDGVLIHIRGDVAGGISIPLTVEALQKQIRQYVTACSGVEVKLIRVEIESSGEDAENAPFAIAPPSPAPLLREPDEKSAPNPTENSEPVPQAQTKQVQLHETEAARPETVQIPPDEDEDDERPLHQRIFSPRPEPCIVPEPPAEEHADSDEISDQAEEAEASAEETSGENLPPEENAVEGKQAADEENREE